MLEKASNPLVAHATKHRLPNTDVQALAALLTIKRFIADLRFMLRTTRETPTQYADFSNVSVSSCEKPGMEGNPHHSSLPFNGRSQDKFYLNIMSWEKVR